MQEDLVRGEGELVSGDELRVESLHESRVRAQEAPPRGELARRELVTVPSRCHSPIILAA